jgi:Ribbon-helix-helix protein, copG family
VANDFFPWEKIIMTNDSRLEVRMPAKLVAAVKDAAKADRRSASELVRILIEDGVKGRLETHHAA